MGNDDGIQADGGDGSRKLRDHLRQAEENDLTEHSHLRLVRTNAQIVFVQDEVHGNDEPTHGLRNACGDCCAHNAYLHREHKQPVQEDVQDCADDRCNSDQCGRTVIAAEELKVDGKCRGDRKQFPPEYRPQW